jgi:hypothetical protein
VSKSRIMPPVCQHLQRNPQRSTNSFWRSSKVTGHSGTEGREIWCLHDSGTITSCTRPYHKQDLCKCFKWWCACWTYPIELHRNYFEEDSIEQMVRAVVTEKKISHHTKYSYNAYDCRI